MRNLNLQSTNKASKKLTRNSLRPVCRRCGDNCTCSDEELDAGGPAAN